MGASPTRRPLEPEAIGAVMEVTKWLKPSISVSRIGDSASVQAATRVNAEHSLPDPDEPNAPAIYPAAREMHEMSAPNTDNDNEGDLPKVLTRVTPPPPSILNEDDY